MGEPRAVGDFTTAKCPSDRLLLHKAAAPFRTSVYPLGTRNALGQIDSSQDPCLCPIDLGVQAFLRPGRETRVLINNSLGVGGAGGRPSSATILGRLRLPVLSVDPGDPMLCLRPGLQQQNRSQSLCRRRARAAPVSRDSTRPRDPWRRR